MQVAFVALIDILGYSEMVQKDCQDSSQGFQRMRRLKDVYNELRSLFNGTPGDVVLFSDTIVLSQPYAPQRFSDFIQLCASVQLKLLKGGILSRGGIAHGRHELEDGFLFSEGLIEAYHLESRHAKSPRILVSEDTYQLVRLVTGNGIEKMILQDRDRLLFLDFLGDTPYSDISESSKAIIDSLSASLDPSILSKLNWFCDYLMFKYPAEQIGCSSRIMEVL